MDDKIRAAFSQVHADEALKQDTLSYLREVREGIGEDQGAAWADARHVPSQGTSQAASSQKSRGRVVSLPQRLVAAAAAIALCLAVGIGGWRAYFLPVATLSIDVNPSIELLVNRFDRVVGVEGVNDDGGRVVQSVDVMHLPYPEAVGTIVSDPAMAPYLEREGLVVVTVLAESQETQDAMLAGIAAVDVPQGVKLTCSGTNAAEAAEARAAGLSLGKYRAYLELAELDPDVAVDDVRGLSMSAIRRMIDERSESAESRGGRGHGQGGGQGQGQGQGGQGQGQGGQGGQGQGQGGQGQGQGAQGGQGVGQGQGGQGQGAQGGQGQGQGGQGGQGGGQGQSARRGWQ